MTWDKDTRLRIITLRFFERGMGKLALLREDFEAYPAERAARRRWVEGIREFADRAQRLADEWESRLAKETESEEPEATHLTDIHFNTPTPPA
jgi:hypothetical protein